MFDQVLIGVEGVLELAAPVQQAGVEHLGGGGFGRMGPEEAQRKGLSAGGPGFSGAVERLDIDPLVGRVPFFRPVEQVESPGRFGLGVGPVGPRRGNGRAGSRQQQQGDDAAPDGLDKGFRHGRNLTQGARDGQDSFWPAGRHGGVAPRRISGILDGL